MEKLKLSPEIIESLRDIVRDLGGQVAEVLIIQYNKCKFRRT
jgi:SepF-like predicted cell division protein (DUF552 family)